MEFEKIPTVPTADEILDRSFRRASVKMRTKTNKDRANVEFVKAVTRSIHDRLVAVIQSFPELDALPPFYREMVDVLYGIPRFRKALGAVGWAARWTRLHGPELSMRTRRSPDTLAARKQAVARLASVVHQVDTELVFLNEVRNVLRTLPHVGDEFTVVIAGYPNVGKSSFLRIASTAAPEIAPYPFTTREIIVGHRDAPSGRVQFIDTPGVLDRPQADRNRIERQALCALVNLANAVLFIVDASEQCGYPLESQLALLEEIRGLVAVPVVAVVNKADQTTLQGYPSMSTLSGAGVDEVIDLLLALPHNE